MRNLTVGLVIFTLFAVPACFLLKPETYDNGKRPNPDGGGPTGTGIGGSCSRSTQCRLGLDCKPDTNTCEPSASKVPGTMCYLSAECLPGLHCSSVGVCAASGTAKEGDRCSIEGDCTSGLICAQTGLYGACAQPGLGDLGALCVQPTDCRAGLLCLGGKCGTLLTVTPWAGATCPESTETVGKVLFKVPRTGEQSEDFYRLPFPNDIRMKNGKVSLAGHPRPGARFLPFDPVERYITAIEEDSTGFGLNTAVYFRFSTPPSFDSFNKEGAMAFVDITPGSPDYNQPLGQSWYVTTGRGLYICPRFLVTRRGFGAPLRPGTTYAVIVRKVITDDKGKPLEQDDDFKAMLAATAPSNSDLAAAWTAYAPLRAWIADKTIDAQQIAAAAVFTTEKAEEPLAKMREAVLAAPLPAVTGMVRCGEAGKTSPCDDGKTGDAHQRGCFSLSADVPFDEYQGKISIPVFQKGTVPYDQPSDGGGVEFDSSGRARIQRNEDVCFSLTVPKGATPAAGWPTVVYAHGTGGSYRSPAELGLAAELATGQAGSGGAAPMATLSYEGALHGTRRGASNKDPSELVYNFLNPRAARDNALQGAADLFVFARSPDAFAAVGIKLDSAKLAVYGHSQGGNAAATAVGYEPGYGAAVLSGTGGTLIYSFLKKTKPVNIASVLPFVLGDAKVDESHPVLNLLQLYFERSDPVNFARRIFSEPPKGVTPRHLLHVYGTADTYSPIETQQTFGQAAGLALVGPMADSTSKPLLPTTTAPARGNLLVGDGKAVTAVQAQYSPSAYDGHFVSTQHPSARRAIREALVTFARDGIPTVAP